MISVIIPVYNVEQYICNTLASLIEQDEKDFELLLVDDGSKDESVSAIRSYLEDKDLKWRLIEKENGGQSSARNLGLKEATGDYIVFLDSDDVVSSHFLSGLRRAIEENDVDFSFCDFQYVKKQCPPQTEKGETYIYDRDELLHHFLLRTVSFVVPSMMVKRDFLIEKRISFCEAIRFSEDQLFIWDVFFRSARAAYLKEKMYGYYLRGQSIMTASPYDRIVSGYRVFSSFVEDWKKQFPDKEKLIGMILPRWALGTLYTAASLVSYDEFRKLYGIMDGKNILKRISGIGERNAILLAIVARISPKLLYQLCRKLDLNG